MIRKTNQTKAVHVKTQAISPGSYAFTSPAKTKLRVNKSKHTN